MGLKRYKPTTPGFRTRQVLVQDAITKNTPEKSLTVSLKSSAGRANTGRISVRRRGGHVKRLYRIVDFKRQQTDLAGVVKSIEYDPYRTANIALVVYPDGSKTYIIAPDGLKVGQVLHSGSKSDIKMGNCLPLKDIPAGSIIHNIELQVNKGAQLVRSAGAAATLMAKNDKFATIKLPSGEVRLVNVLCTAVIGQVGNLDVRNISLGKAGASRWRGRRPKVRGSAMNACDHPHGGGEGKAPIGHAGPMTPWGKPTLGYKTRKKRNKTGKFIVKRRK